LSEDASALWAFLEIEVALPSGRHLQYILDAQDTPNFILGRSSPVQIDDAMVSQAHAMVFFDTESGWRVKDLHSTNGTYLNGERLYDVRPLSSGDTIALGKSTVTVGEMVADGAGVARTTPFAAWDSPSDHVFVRDLQIEIDQAKKERDVQEIVESDYFQNLREKFAKLRRGGGK
jgi:pSer/pThr/pTyr-binding forkhead associated (FHA) protein